MNVFILDDDVLQAKDVFGRAKNHRQISRLVKSKIRDRKHIAGKISCGKRRRESDKRRYKRFESGRNASVNVFVKYIWQ